MFRRAAALATVAAVLTLSGCEPQPTLHDPVQVRVLNGGAAVDIAIGHCFKLDVTEVKVVASQVKDAVASDEETIVWDYIPAVPTQTLFQTAGEGGKVVTPFTSLTNFPPSDEFGVYVYYIQSTAPRRFADRRAIDRVFHLVQSASEIQAYSALVGATC